MLVRQVIAHLKPNSLAKFTNLVECEILPWLRKQDGFLDLITLSIRGGREVATLSFWDHKANTQAYNCCGYPEGAKVLSELLDGAPNFKTFDVVNSTLQSFAPARTCEAEKRAQEFGPV